MIGTGACNARSASRRCRFTEGFARAPRGFFLKCSSLWASESLRECLPKLAVEVTARPEFSACMQRSLAQPGSGADGQIKLWCPCACVHWRLASRSQYLASYRYLNGCRRSANNNRFRRPLNPWKAGQDYGCIRGIQSIGYW